MDVTIKKRNTDEWNAVIVALFLFQYSILTPAMNYISGTLLVSCCGLLLIAALLLRNAACRVNAAVVASFLIVAVLLVANTLLTGIGIKGISVFALICLPVLVLFLFPFHYRVFLQTCCKLSIITFFVLALYPFLPGYAYMRFGYGMLPVVLFSYIALVYSDTVFASRRSRPIRLLYLAVLLLSTAEILLYGARGTLVSIALFAVLDRLLLNKRKVIRNGLMVLLAGGAVAFASPLLDLFEKLSKKLGIYSYTITKLKMQIESGFASASSGRMKIYRLSLDRIREHPIIGNGIDATEEGVNYAHNLFLQVGEDLGVAAVIVMLAFLIWQLYCMGMRKRAIEEKLIREVLFSISVGRLLFSSTLWRRPEFWMLFFFSVSVSCRRSRDTLA